MISPVAPSPISAPSPAPAVSGKPSPTSTADDAKLQEAKTALTALKQNGKGSANPARASQAKAKLDALRAQLKTLMMIGGDPKTVAREAAQIAKEIGEAAAAYADAGGTGAGAAAADAAPPMPEEGVQGETAATDSPGAAAASADAAPAAATEQKASAAGSSGAAVGPSAPDEVIQDAKTLAASAKAVIEAAHARAKREHRDDPSFRQAEATMGQAQKDIEDGAKVVGGGDAPGGYTASGTGVSAPATAAVPAVSVQA